jgi:hypothetical protein
MTFEEKAKMYPGFNLVGEDSIANVAAVTEHQNKLKMWQVTVTVLVEAETASDALDEVDRNIRTGWQEMNAKEVQ